MDKPVIIIVLALLALAFYAAIKKKSIFQIVSPIIDKIKKNGKKVPDATEEVKNSGKHTGGTIVVPDLLMHQLTADGSSFYKHEIEKGSMCDDSGEMVGISVSHPGADSDGIKLFGVMKKDGTYDENNPGTYAALTVNTDAILLGYDDDGFYGQVTNPKAKVYIGVNGKAKPVSNDELFEIKNGTYILVGTQWLYFVIPEIPAFPGQHVIDNDVNLGKASTGPAPGVPEFNEDNTRGKIKKRTGPVKANVEKNPGAYEDSSHRFHINE